MTREDTKQLLRILQVSYPNTYRNMPDDEKQDTMLLYYDMFKDYDTEVVATALKSYVRSNKQPPTVAGLQESIDLLMNTVKGDDKDLNYLWSEFKRAVKGYNGFNGRELFDSVPREVQSFLVAPSGIKEYGQLEKGIVDTVVRGQFNKAVTARIERDAKISKIPGDAINKLIQSMDYKQLMEGEDE